MTHASQPHRFAVFHSPGHDLQPVLNALRRVEPNAEITLWVPKGHRLPETVREMADAARETELPHYSPRQVRACLRLIRRLRAQRYDAFAVLFDSPQLRLLAALSGAPQCWLATGDGRLTALPINPLLVLAEETIRGIAGRLTYLRVWISVHFFPARR